MSKNPIELRRKRYFQLNSQISQLDNNQLRLLFDSSESHQSGTGWGMNHTIIFGQSKVFVKRIPITDLEYNNLFSTRNLYHLPPAFNYGFGSTGLGVFRELIAHIKTTHWVLEDEIANFPLLYHYRIMPFSGQCKNVEINLENWGNHVNIRKYVFERAIANYELVLFLEYIPYVLETWLRENPNQLKKSLDDLRTTITFLRTKKIIHFDAHFRNILTDSEQTYLTDFGLVLDKSFDLTREEEDFFEQNRFYDYGEVLRNLSHMIRWSYDSCSETAKRKIREKYGVEESLPSYQQGAILLDNIESIYAEGDIKLDEFYVTCITKYRTIIALMQNFFADMWGNSNKDTKLPHTQLKLLLKETGFLE